MESRHNRPTHVNICMTSVSPACWEAAASDGSLRIRFEHCMLSEGKQPKVGDFIGLRRVDSGIVEWDSGFVFLTAPKKGHVAFFYKTASKGAPRKLLGFLGTLRRLLIPLPSKAALAAKADMLEGITLGAIGVFSFLVMLAFLWVIGGLITTWAVRYHGSDAFVLGTGAFFIIYAIVQELRFMNWLLTWWADRSPQIKERWFGGIDRNKK